MSANVRTSAVVGRDWPTEIAVVTMAACGASALGYGFVAFRLVNLSEAAVLLVLTVIASRLKVTLPGATGNMSVNLPFLLIAALHLGVAEAGAIGAMSAIVQGWPAKAPNKILFNSGNLTVTIVATNLVLHRFESLLSPATLLIAVAGATYAVLNTLPVAGIISLTEHRSTLAVWYGILKMTFPYYLLSTALAAVAADIASRYGWLIAVALLPLMIGVYASYREYFASKNASPKADAATA